MIGAGFLETLRGASDYRAGAAVVRRFEKYALWPASFELVWASCPTFFGEAAASLFVRMMYSPCSGVC